jgi:hypothetical protein
MTPERLKPTLQQLVDCEMAISHLQDAINRCAALRGHPGIYSDDILQMLNALTVVLEELQAIRRKERGDAAK